MVTLSSYCDHIQVGIRELKAHLSEYVGKAAAGEHIIVTDRGRPVAQLASIGDASTLDRGISEGWVTPPRRSRLEPIARCSATRSTADVLDEDRG